MNVNRITYTLFVAFLSVIATLLVVNITENRDGNASPEAGEGAEDSYTLEEVAEHDGEESCWKVIDGVVYDITDYMPEHPTSMNVLLRWCGREATQAWETKSRGRPHSARAESMLADYRIGVLADDGGR